MNINKAAFLNVLSRTDGPRRETLRRELARARPAGKGADVQRKLVLASGSPRRLTLLKQAGVMPDALRPASIDETPRRGEMPRSLVSRLSRAKGLISSATSNRATLPAISPAVAR